MTDTKIFDKLMTSVSRIDSLLSDRQPGLFTWNELLGNSFKEFQNVANEIGVPVEAPASPPKGVKLDNVGDKIKRVKSLLTDIHSISSDLSQGGIGTSDMARER